MQPTIRATKLKSSQYLTRQQNKYKKHSFTWETNVVQLSKVFPAFRGIQSVITVSPGPPSVPYSETNIYIYIYPKPQFVFPCSLSSHVILETASRLFPSRFPKKTYAFLVYAMYTTGTVYYYLLSRIVITFHEEYYEIFRHVIFFSFLLEFRSRLIA